MTRQIASPSNPLIKEIRKLRNKKERENSGNFYVEGIRAVGEALSTRQTIKNIIYCQELLESDFGNQLISDLPDDFVGLIEVTAEVFDSFSLKEGPQGLAAVVHQSWASLEDVTADRGMWVALESIQDPGNLGTILRSLDATGGKGAIMLGQSTDPYHPSAVRASTGAIFSQKLIRTDLRSFQEWKSRTGYPLVGTYCGDVTPYRDYNYPQDLIILMGSEQKGLQDEHLSLCDDLVTIPMNGSVDSLNVSVAASIVLFEIYDQKGRAG
ncbi:MAG: RNA methyltransferase [Chloroflexi bacterium]|nr:RNA methyltransferase [Chloroflexota bacterium]